MISRGERNLGCVMLVGGCLWVHDGKLNSEGRVINVLYDSEDEVFCRDADKMIFFYQDALLWQLIL